MLVRPSKTPQPRLPKTATDPGRTLAEEKADFTAEGAPPPGSVAAGKAPVLPKSDTAAAPVQPAKRASTGRQQPPSPPGPVRRASKRNPAAWRGGR